MISPFMEIYSINVFTILNLSSNDVLKRVRHYMGKIPLMVKHEIVLGNEISRKENEVDKAKVNVIAKLPIPECIIDIRSFLAHASFYCRFIKDFSKIAKPLTNLLAKDVPFTFDS